MSYWKCGVCFLCLTNPTSKSVFIRLSKVYHHCECLSSLPSSTLKSSRRKSYDATLSEWGRTLPRRLGSAGYKVLYLLTYSMVQSPSCAANWFAASQEIPHISRNRQPSLSWASQIQSIYPHPTSWRPILILSTHLHLDLSSGLFPSGFPSKTPYTLCVAKFK